MATLRYLTPEKVEEYNTLVLSMLKIKKADRPMLLSRKRLLMVLEGCKEAEGDLYDKAAVLLTGIIQKHPFASGNRRTAFIAAKAFIVVNGGRFMLKDEPAQARIMVGIREGYYAHQEVKEWIHHGTIREFRR